MHFIIVASGDRFVKVGITTQPKARALAIARDFRKPGDAMARFSVMPGMPAGYGVESSIRRDLDALLQPLVAGLLTDSVEMKLSMNRSIALQQVLEQSDELPEIPGCR